MAVHADTCLSTAITTAATKTSGAKKVRTRRGVLFCQSLGGEPSEFLAAVCCARRALQVNEVTARVASRTAHLPRNMHEENMAVIDRERRDDRKSEPLIGTKGAFLSANVRRSGTRQDIVPVWRYACRPTSLPCSLLPRLVLIVAIHGTWESSKSAPGTKRGTHLCTLPPTPALVGGCPCGI